MKEAGSDRKAMARMRLKDIEFRLIYQTQECVKAYKKIREIGARMVYNANRHTDTPSPGHPFRCGDRAISNQ
jgi:hypothetical protein